MILLIDNYDSFTYNLVQYLAEVRGQSEEIRVFRNDALRIEDIRQMEPSRIVISPGPCTPDEAGLSLDIIRRLHQEYPILGVCLGHQAIGQAFGGTVVRAAQPMHGKTSFIQHNGSGIFRNIENPFRATRYHSLIVERSTLPSCLRITAETDSGIIMGLEHKDYPHVIGLQFHPESIMTDPGKQLLANFLSLR
jgi:anthranilate synthase/aminodeoxychorismate synthase-like glutamine amidotransferase